MAKVFISHRGSDADVCARLAGDLRSRGHTVWLDADELRVGDSLVSRINDGLADASYLIMVYSDDPSYGAWMAREWMSSLARQIDGEAIRLLPARIGDSRGPQILRDLMYADLSRDWSSGVAALHHALERP